VPVAAAVVGQVAGVTAVAARKRSSVIINNAHIFKPLK
jgi:hypothetical protein